LNVWAVKATMIDSTMSSWNTGWFNHQPGINQKMVETTSASTGGWNNKESTGHLDLQSKCRLIQLSTRNQPESGWNNQRFT